MSYQAIREYLVAIVERYKKLDRKNKTALLNEATQVTGLSRKHLIRQLQNPKEVLAKRKPSGRKPKYDPVILTPFIAFLWVQMERISARRMKAAFRDWLPAYEKEDPRFTVAIRLQLERMSAATLDRILRKIRASSEVRKGLSTTCPARYMKNKIPLNTFDAKIDRPGYAQTDTVAHCGDSTAGQYVNTITLTDIDSTWTENRAIFTKKGIEVRKQFVDLDASLPFELLAVNADSGSEFLNTPMVEFMRRPFGGNKINFTRSRPYRKNDNCYVEQKNFTHVRELFGYERIEAPKFAAMMNEIYKTCWNPLQNFFLPTFKLKEKIRVGARIVKKFDAPETPYDRLMKSPHLSEERKEKLRSTKKTLNPFRLKADLENMLKVFFDELRKSKTREVA